MIKIIKYILFIFVFILLTDCLCMVDKDISISITGLANESALKGLSYKDFIIQLAKKGLWNKENAKKAIKSYELHDEKDISKNAGGLRLFGKTFRGQIPYFNSNIGVFNTLTSLALFWSYWTVLDKVYDKVRSKINPQADAPAHRSIEAVQGNPYVVIAKPPASKSIDYLKNIITGLGAAYIAYYSSANPRYLLEDTAYDKAYYRRQNIELPTLFEMPDKKVV